MQKDNVVGLLGSGISWLATFIQTNETLQIISIICAVLASLSTIIYNLIRSINNAKKDGKITAEEVEEIAKEANEGLKDLNQKLNGEKDNDK